MTTLSSGWRGMERLVSTSGGTCGAAVREEHVNRTKRYIGRLARRSITAGMAAGLVAGLVAAGPGVVSSQAASVAGLGAGNGAGATADPASYVNPLIGTGSGGDVVGQVDTFPGASAPFGMLTFSPDTAPTGADGGGYYSGDS